MSGQSAAGPGSEVLLGPGTSLDAVAQRKVCTPAGNRTTIIQPRNVISILTELPVRLISHPIFNVVHSTTVQGHGNWCHQMNVHPVDNAEKYCFVCCIWDHAMGSYALFNCEIWQEGQFVIGRDIVDLGVKLRVWEVIERCSYEIRVYRDRVKRNLCSDTKLFCGDFWLNGGGITFRWLSRNYHQTNFFYLIIKVFSPFIREFVFPDSLPDLRDTIHVCMSLQTTVIIKDRREGQLIFPHTVLIVSYEFLL